MFLLHTSAQELDGEVDGASLILGWSVRLAVKIYFMAADVGFRWRWLTWWLIIESEVTLSMCLIRFGLLSKRCRPSKYSVCVFNRSLLISASLGHNLVQPQFKALGQHCVVSTVDIRIIHRVTSLKEITCSIWMCKTDGVTLKNYVKSKFLISVKC